VDKVELMGNFLYHSHTHNYAVEEKGDFSAAHGLEGKKGFVRACQTSKSVWISSTECKMASDVFTLIPAVALTP